MQYVILLQRDRFIFSATMTDRNHKVLEQKNVKFYRYIANMYTFAIFSQRIFLFNILENIYFSYFRSIFRRHYELFKFESPAHESVAYIIYKIAHFHNQYSKQLFFVLLPWKFYMSRICILTILTCLITRV